MLVANHLVFPPLLIWTIVIEDVSSAEDVAQSTKDSRI